MEVAIGVLIVGILAAAAAPKFTDSLHWYQVQAAAERVRADLNMARRLAMSSSANRTIQFSTAGNSYTILGIDSPDRVGRPYTIQLGDSPYRSLLMSTSLGGDEAVQFNYYGVPDSGGQIVIASGGFERTVQIDPDTGKARVL